VDDSVEVEDELLILKCKVESREEGEAEEDIGVTYLVLYI
jgi:hypothetical protein